MKTLKAIIITLILLISGIGVNAQSFLAKGTVTDSQTGDPVIGAAVLEKGTGNGVVTDLDGMFSIQVNGQAVLSFECIGYQPMELPALATEMTVRMEPEMTELDEATAIGYGVQKKSSLTGAVTSVKSDDIQGRAVTSLSTALGGKVAGINTYTGSAAPGSSSSIQIRGIGSNGSSLPLFVIDGRVAGGAGDLDINDIESIEVLKDGASAAIYGAAAGNGVILITTKRGKGTGTVSYEGQFTVQALGFRPEVMNSRQFIDYYTDQGGLSLAKVYKWWDFNQDTNWLDVAFEPSIMHRHNLKFQGGNDKSDVYVSLSYLDNNGMVAGDSDTHKRLTGMVNASYKIKPWLEVGTNNNLEYSRTRSVAEGNGGLIMSSLTLDPLTAPTYTLENMPDNMRTAYNNPVKYGELLSDGKGNYYGMSPFVSTNQTNPLILRDRNVGEGRSFSLAGTLYANLSPIKNLTLTSRLGYIFSSGESYGVAKDYFAENSSGNYQNFLKVSASNSSGVYYQWENFANYNIMFAKEHALTLMAGMSYSQSRASGVSGSKSGTAGTNGNGGDIGFLRDDPLYWYFAYATPNAVKSVSGGEASYSRKLAYFGRARYEYKGKYLAQVSLRADAADSSILPPGNRWGYFPAASLGWIVSREPFMESVKDWMSYLKLRASWGRNGNLASLGGWSYDVNIVNVGKYNFSNILDYSYGYAPTVTGNPDLKWETSEQWDLGMDVNFFAHRLSFSLDLYQKNTWDLIVSGAKLSNITGFAASPINAGVIRNRGIDMELSWMDHVGAFSYGARANMGLLNNKVTKVHESVNRIQNGISTFEKGYPAWYFRGYKCLGIDKATGDPIFADLSEVKDGVIEEEDKTYIGKGIPDCTYGVTLFAGWKGFDFLMFGTGVAGVDIFNNYNRSDIYISNKLTWFARDRWTPENTNGTNPRADYSNFDKYYVSDACVFDGSWFKIKQIQFGYSLPQGILKKISISNLRVYASLEDFFTFTSYIGFDPEVTSMGIDNGAYPNPRKVLLGINLTF